jgi:ribonuclease D
MFSEESNDFKDEIDDICNFTILDEIKDDNDAELALAVPEDLINTDRDDIKENSFLPFLTNCGDNIEANAQQNEDKDQQDDEEKDQQVDEEKDQQGDGEKDQQDSEEKEQQDVKTVDLLNTEEIKFSDLEKLPEQTQSCVLKDINCNGNSKEVEETQDSELPKEEENEGNVDCVSGGSQQLDECKSEKDEEQEVAETEVDTHPYLYLIENFEVPKELLNFTTVGACKSLNETPMHIINTRGNLLKLLQTLKGVKEISLDLQVEDKEYEGIICLIEISTKDADYIIDAIKLKNELLLLTEIFINPKILKIVFQSETILARLQQKLHLYLVNIFDVEKAGLIISHPVPFPRRASLEFIMQHDYSYEREKLFKADYRVRPLPNNYKSYCRSATHYLIYIYHDYKNRLLISDPDSYELFLKDCREACKKIYDESKALNFKSIEGELKNRHNCELEVLKKLFDWRNTVAQKHNKKAETILPKYALLNLATFLPDEEEFILAFTQSPYVKDNILELRALIHETRLAFRFYENKHGKKKKRNFAILSQQAHIKKRKFNDQFEVQNKRRGPEGSFNRPENAWRKANDCNKSKQTGSQYSSKKNNKKANQNASRHSNATVSSDSFRPSPFLNQNLTPSHVGDHNQVKIWEPVGPESIQTHVFSGSPSLNSVNAANLMVQTWTDISSSASFQNTSGMSNDSPFRSPFEGAGANRTFNAQSNAFSREEDSLQRSLTNLKQTRDNLRSQAYNSAGSSGDFVATYRDLNAVDHRIDTVERKILRIQEKNNRKVENMFRRRY